MNITHFTSVPAKTADIVGRRHAVRQARARVSEALRAEPFQPVRLEQSLSELRNETTKTQALLHRALVQAAQAGSPEARRELSRGFDQRPRDRR